MRFVSFAFPLCCFGDGQLWQNGLLDDPGLLQVQTRLISNVPVADPISLSTLEAMDTLVNKMSLGDPSQAEIDLVTGLITTLEDEFKPKLVTDSQEDLLAYSDKITAHNLCKDHMDTRFDTVTGDVAKLSLAFTEKRSKHAGCRKATKSYSVFETDVDQVAVGTWPTLAGVTGETQVGALSTLCTSRTAFVDDVDSYRILPPSGVSANCALDQTSFEEEFCTWVSSKTSACLACDECVTQVGAAAFKASILTRDASRRATYQTIMKLQCRLQYLADAYTSGDSSDSADADTCGDTLLPDVTHYGYDVLVTPITIPSCLSDADITNPVMPSTETASAGYEMMGGLGCSARNELGVQTCPVGQDCVDWAKSVCDENESCVSFEYHLNRCQFSTTCTADIATSLPNYPNIVVYVKRLSGNARCTAWKNQEYSWTSERTAVTECRATCQIPDAHVTVSVEGCVDSDDDLCPFYSLHHDACAAYNDDAQSKCCACGGGTTAIPPLLESTCLEAAIAQFGDMVTQSRSYLKVGSWDHVPTGCSVQKSWNQGDMVDSGDWAAHWNRNPNPTRPRPTYTLVTSPVSYQNSKCSTGGSRSFRTTNQETPGACRALCRDTTGCRHYSIGSYAGGMVCMGCTTLSDAMPHGGFTAYDLE